MQEQNKNLNDYCPNCIKYNRKTELKETSMSKEEIKSKLESVQENSSSLRVHCIMIGYDIFVCPECNFWTFRKKQKKPTIDLKQLTDLEKDLKEETLKKLDKRNEKKMNKLGWFRKKK